MWGEPCHHVTVEDQPPLHTNYPEFTASYLEHMRVEETQILPAAAKLLAPADWEVLDSAFQSTRDPLAGGEREPCYDRLFTRIVMTAPAPIGVGP